MRAAVFAVTQAVCTISAPVRIYAAGSLKAAMQALMGASGLPTDAFAEPEFGPSGLMRERLERAGMPISSRPPTWRNQTGSP